MQKLRYLLLILLVSSCTTYPEAIEDVLQQAGNNRKELEKVLKHYSRNPADTLKLRAAEFLIENMPGKYSEYMEGQWNDLATVYLRWTSSSDKQMVLDTYKLDEPVRKDDVVHITAEYLINNIEFAFKVWKEMPWGKDISFDIFCEEILPYRVSTEPLENWREKVLTSFADLYKSFIEDTTGITSVQACCRVNDVLPRFRMDKDFPSMSYTQLMATTRSTCDGMAALAIFTMRGLGIPVTFDYTPKWVDLSTGHSWNSVYDNTSGKHISFMGTQSNPGQPHQGTTLLKTKAFRRMYGHQHNVSTDEEYISPLLQNINHIVDITSETEHCIDIWFPIPKDHSTQRGNIFLATLNEMEWQPIAWGIFTPWNLEFHSVKNGLYLPVYYRDGVLTPAGNPFKFQHATCRFYQPHSFCTNSFRSIAPSDYIWCHKMIGGRFEVATQIDFSDAKTIHIVENIPGPHYNNVSVKLSSAYRYVRYVSPVDGHGNVSILEFYDENNEKIRETVIGTPGANVATSNDKVFDGDIDTFFEAASNLSWVGLDLGEPRQISRIRYLPRTTGNGIYEGHVYELFYWNSREWQSLGQNTATSHILQYNAPSNALFFLKNVTKNRMYKKPFVIEGGTQHWL